MIINKTPHPVHILDGDNNVIKTFHKDGELIRLKSETVRHSDIDGVPTSRTVFGNPEGLQDQVDGVYYIVSQLVKSALPNRSDLLVPAEVVRDADGNIIGCRSLGR